MAPTAAYREVTLEMYDWPSKTRKEAYNENKDALREGAFGTISGYDPRKQQKCPLSRCKYFRHDVRPQGLQSSYSPLSTCKTPLRWVRHKRHSKSLGLNGFLLDEPEVRTGQCRKNRNPRFTTLSVKTMQ